MSSMCATQKPNNRGGSNLKENRKFGPMCGAGKAMPGRRGASTLIFKGPFCIRHKALPRGKSILIGE